MHVFDPVVMAWIDLTAAVTGNPHPARDEHGFTSAGGKLYVHGGCNHVASNGNCDGRASSKRIRVLMIEEEGNDSQKALVMLIRGWLKFDKALCESVMYLN